MGLDKVSIMIPTYNQEKYILRAIESARAQDYGNLDIVVADDCSTDSTQEVVEKYIRDAGDVRLRYVRNYTNLGILRNYHANLFHNASGEWAVNLDGDDFFIDAQFISKAMALAERDSAVALIFGSYAEYDQSSGRTVEIINRDHPEVMTDEYFYRAYAAGEISWNHNSIVYRRTEAIRIGFYWDEKIPRNDWESFLRLIAGHKAGYLPTIAAAWTQHDANETRRLDINKYLNNFVLIDAVRDFARGRGMVSDFLDDWHQRMRYRSTRGSCVGYLRNRDFRGILIFLWRAGRIDPMLSLRAACDLGLLARGILALNPSAYAAVKRFIHRMGGR